MLDFKDLEQAMISVTELAAEAGKTTDTKYTALLLVLSHQTTLLAAAVAELRVIRAQGESGTFENMLSRSRR